MPAKNKIQQLGFVIEDIGPGQLSYLCISQANQWLKENANINITMFYENTTNPCLGMDFARFHTRDTVLFTGHLICTSIKGVLATEQAARAKRYYYINDLEWTRPWFDSPHDEVKRILVDDSIIKFARCKDHHKYVTGMGIDVHPKIVQDFDMKAIMEIVNGR